VTGLIILAMTVIMLVSQFLFVDRLLMLVYRLIDIVVYLLLFAVGFLAFLVVYIFGGARELPMFDLKEKLENGGTAVFPDSKNFEIPNGMGGREINVLLLFTVFAGVLFIALVYALVKSFQKLMGDETGARRRGRTTGDEFTRLTAEDNASFQPPRPPVLRWGVTNRERIRRMFYAKVKRYGARKRFKLSNADTSGDMSEKIREMEDISELRAVYDKARYSGLEITKDEIERVKK